MQVKKQPGWILIDVIITTFIVAVALTALAMAFRQSTIAGTAAQNYNQAVYIAQDTLEYLKKNDGKSSAASLDWNPKEKTIKSSSGFTFQVDVKSPPTEVSGNSLIKVCQVTVTWKDSASSSDRSVDMIGYYYLIP